jgi:hypothetical protein
MGQVIVKLELNHYRVEWVEARSLRKGFSVVARDIEVSRRARRRFISKENYNWRAFARCLPGLCEPDMLNPYESEAPFVNVAGEDGLVAEILRYAYACCDSGMPDFAEFLIEQTDDCLSQIEIYTGEKLSENVQSLLLEIESNINYLNLDRNICALTRPITGRDHLDLELLLKRLEALSDEKSKQDGKQRENIIRPFRDIIESRIARFDSRGRRFGYSSDQSRARSFLEGYILSEGRLPSGAVHVKSSPESGMRWDLGVIDFDEE